MPEKKTAFYAYPGKPTEIVQTIRSAIAGFNGASPAFNLEGWEKNDISGIPLSADLLKNLDLRISCGRCDLP